MAHIEHLERSFNQVKGDFQLAFEHFEDAQRKWYEYDNVIRDQNDLIQKINERSNKRLEELDENIKNNVVLQSKLRALSAKNPLLSKEVEQIISENPYIKTTTRWKKLGSDRLLFLNTLLRQFNMYK